jgi:hypothetical protein
VHDTLNEALLASDVLGDCVVTVQVVSGPPFDPEITNVDHACSGWFDTYAAFEHADSTILVNDRKVFLLASSLDIVPVPLNTITINSQTYSIISVALDAAGVAYVCQCRA